MGTSSTIKRPSTSGQLTIHGPGLTIAPHPGYLRLRRWRRLIAPAPRPPKRQPAPFSTTRLFAEPVHAAIGPYDLRRPAGLTLLLGGTRGRHFGPPLTALRDISGRL
jgi:hypothetical protein